MIRPRFRVSTARCELLNLKMRHMSILPSTLFVHISVANFMSVKIHLQIALNLLG